MGLTNWFKFKFRNSRGAPRSQVHQNLKCQIQRMGKDEFHEAWVCDISKTGIGLLIRSDECEVGEKIITHLTCGPQSIQTAAGQIVGQDIVYYGPNKTVENSFIRYSVRFEVQLPDSQLQRLQMPEAPTQN